MTAPRPMPEDYLAVRLTMGAKGAAEHYRADKTTVRRWDGELDAVSRERVAVAGRARQSRAAKRNLAQSPYRKQAAAQRAVNTVVHAAPKVSGGVIDNAKQYLRRHYPNVFDAGAVFGRALNGVYVVGNHRVDAAGLLALAAEKGFDADAWRRLA